MSYPILLMDIISLAVSALILALLALMFVQARAERSRRHREAFAQREELRIMVELMQTMTRLVEQSTPVQLAESVKALAAKMDGISTLLDAESILDLRSRQTSQGKAINDHEHRIAVLETEAG